MLHHAIRFENRMALYISMSLWMATPGIAYAQLNTSGLPIRQAETAQNSPPSTLPKQPLDTKRYLKYLESQGSTYTYVTSDAPNIFEHTYKKNVNNESEKMTSKNQPLSYSIMTDFPTNTPWTPNSPEKKPEHSMFNALPQIPDFLKQTEWFKGLPTFPDPK